MVGNRRALRDSAQEYSEQEGICEKVAVRRRRAGQAPIEVAEGAAEGATVQWRATVLLNLVLQASYCLSVATCRYISIEVIAVRTLLIFCLLELS